MPTYFRCIVCINSNCPFPKAEYFKRLVDMMSGLKSLKSAYPTEKQPVKNTYVIYIAKVSESRPKG